MSRHQAYGILKIGSQTQINAQHILQVYATTSVPTRSASVEACQIAEHVSLRNSHTHLNIADS